MVLMSTLPPWHFSQKIHRIFPSVNHRQSGNTQPTHPPCLCLTGWLSATKPAGHVWPAKNISTFTEQKSHSATLPTPQGIMPGPGPWAFCPYPPGQKPPWLFKHRKRIAGRQAKKFCLKLDTVFKNPDIYWPGMPGKCLHRIFLSKWAECHRTEYSCF